jgi:hypothetical protein
MAEATAVAKATGLIPMAHVADVRRSVDFYKMLGMELRGSLKGSTGGLQWAHVACERAELMFARVRACDRQSAGRAFLPLLA